MDNNDILIRLRYAKDIKNTEFVKIFAIEAIKVDKQFVIDMLQKSTFSEDHPDGPPNEKARVDNKLLEDFLNGYITYNRGPAKIDPNGPARSKYLIESDHDVNNVVLKKLKIALNLTSDDMVELYKSIGLTVSSSEISAFLRKKGHKHYRECGDNFTRNFLLALSKKYRNDGVDSKE